MNNQLIKFSVQGGVAEVVLNSPDNLNAMTSVMADEFFAAIESVKVDKSIRLLVVTGEGKAFSAGGNLKMLEDKITMPRKENETYMLDFYRKFLSVYEVEVPVIAAINGHAIGAGLCMSLACDYRFCSNIAKLGVNFAHLGLHPGMGATYFLQRVVGEAQAARLLMSGEIIRADEALRIGLVGEVVENESFLARKRELIDLFLQAGPSTARSTKASLRAAYSSSLSDALIRESIEQGISYASSEFAEGISAAIAKRPAKFV